MNKKHGFTLIELLVVITIILILAGLLFPTLMGIIASARKTKCVGQLRSFGVALKTYEGEIGSGRMPRWLSNLRRGKYQDDPRVYICPCDSANGWEGARPDWILGDANQFAETDDVTDHDDLPADLAIRLRKEVIDSAFRKKVTRITYNCRFKPCDKKQCGKMDSPERKSYEIDVHSCSYQYEFTREICSWHGEVGAYGKFNTGDNTWYNVKQAERRNFKGADVYNLIPTIRCFYHIPKSKDGNLQDYYLDDKENPNATLEFRQVQNLRMTGEVSESWPTSWHITTEDYY